MTTMRFRRSRREPPPDRPEAGDGGLPACPSCGARPGAPAPVLTCPGCGTPSDIIAKAIAVRTLREGARSEACTACEQVTIVVEPDMVCAACRQVRPGIDALLRARFAEHGPGDAADAPCVGCGYFADDSTPSFLDVIIDCQGCGDEIAIPEDDIPAGQGMQLSCGRCRAVTIVPAAIWCPTCGRHLRRDGIAELVRDATRERGA